MVDFCILLIYHHAAGLSAVGTSPTGTVVSYFKSIEAMNAAKKPIPQAAANNPKPSPKYTGNEASDGKANALAFAPESPTSAPPIHPPMHTAIIGFRLGRFMPYMTGSVTPRIAETMPVTAIERNFFRALPSPFVFIRTARPAPA